MDAQHQTTGQPDTPPEATSPDQRAAKPVATPSSTVGLPTPPRGAEVLLMADAAALLGVRLNALRIWINGRGSPSELSAHDRGAMVRPTRYRAPGPWTRNPNVCFLRSDIEALAAQIAASYKPVPHPDAVNFPDCHLVPIVTRDRRPVHALIDSADLPLIEGLSWNIAPRAGGYRSERVVVAAANHNIMLKQIVMGQRTIDRTLPIGDQHTAPIDDDARIIHLDGDDLNCRRSNLEARTAAQVVHGNSKMQSRNGKPLTSQYKGVSWSKEEAKWVTHIRKDGKSYYVGMFHDEEDAAREYDNAARWLFGEYAKLNFPMERPALRVPTAGALSKPGAIERVAA